ncbi:MAG: transglycosylase domain-containing protein [Solirubrobacteraceae bacterium]
MADDDQTPTPGELIAPIQFAPPRRRWPGGRGGDRDRPTKPKVRKLRLMLFLAGLGTLALISTVFGMMMAVASDLPQLENSAQYRKAANSFLYDDHWRPIGIFAPPNHVVIDKSEEISQSMKDAIIAIEDKRFYSESGVDVRGIGRALAADVTGGARQGASTIAQQFVKNALSQQNNRTVFEKLREAALAYHLTRKWTKDKILTEYLNSIYFGSGAYGVESAARVYFGKQHGFDSTGVGTGTQASQPTSRCGDGTPQAPLPKCASVLEPWETALIAGMVASPTAFDPIAHPHAAMERRNLVLKDMLAQRYINPGQYAQGIAAPLPTESQIQQPSEPSAAPYFTSWLRPQLLATVGRGVSPASVVGPAAHAAAADYRAYSGGLKIRTSLDLEMQSAAEQAIKSDLPQGSNLPTASLVTIDNKTGEVRAMVGGQDYTQTPFNLATEGHRQPGSAFKPFTLATALESGMYGPDSIITSAPQSFVVPNSAGKEHFIVHNFGNTYSGPITLTQATTISDNSVYSQVGIHTGPGKISRLATHMGIRSPVSSNYAMILGGLTEGVTPLDLAHAYQTFATGGKRVFDPAFGAPDQGPTGIAEIQCPTHVCGGSGRDTRDNPTFKRVLPASVAQTVHDILTTVVQSGTATSAAISGVDVAGKTGTTENYGDAWFVGWTPQLTTAVWVGYPNKLVSMSTLYNGAPVEGGTYPAIIWHDFMVQALATLAQEQAAAPGAHTTTTATTTNTSTDTTGSATAGPSGSGSGAATSSTATSATGAPGAGTGNGAPTAPGGGGGSGGGSGGSGSGPSSGGGGGSGSGPPAGGGSGNGGGGTGSGGSGSPGAGSGGGGGGGGGGSGPSGSGGAGIGGR